MSEFGDLIPEFVEESLEHLKNIEEDIIIIEQGSADSDLINRVFRAVHSIKGGSSFLGLKNIEKLSHKMEDLFNLVRNDEMDFTSEISSCVLKSIDTLKDMLEDSEESDNYDIRENLRELKKCLEQKPVDEVKERIKEDIQDTTPKIDKKAFDNLRKQGKKVYLIQFELREESLGGKNPMDFFSEIEKTGEILVRNVDMELVLKDDNFTGEGIPLSILYASVLERDLVSHIFGIDEKTVKEVKPSSLLEEELIGDTKTKQSASEEPYYNEVETFLSQDDEDEAPRRPASKKKRAPRHFREEEPDFEDEDVMVRDIPENKHPDVQGIEPIEHEDEIEVQIEEEFEEDELDIDAVKEMNEYLTFLVGDEEYGIGITQVHEIVTLHEITPVPGADSFTKGVINLRGDIIPVYDFRLRMKFDGREYDYATIILIVRVQDKKAGVIVDRVSEVIHLTRGQITDAPQMQQIPSEYVIGIGQKEGKFIILLKLKEIFKISEVTIG